MTTKFQVSTNRSGRKRTVKVLVYDNLKDLRRDADKWNMVIRSEAQDNSHVLGIAHRNERIRVEDDYSMPEVGIIRLHNSHLRTGIISHEVAHIALWIYELDIKKPLNTEDNENEEIFCHILGDLNARLVNKLYEKQFFQPTQSIKQLLDQTRKDTIAECIGCLPEKRQAEFVKWHSPVTETDEKRCKFYRYGGFDHAITTAKDNMRGME